jgi:hypothetical protein
MGGGTGGLALTISSVRNSFYISQRILTKLSQKLCHQVLWRTFVGVL